MVAVTLHYCHVSAFDRTGPKGLCKNHSDQKLITQQYVEKLFYWVFYNDSPKTELGATDSAFGNQ